MKIIVIGSIEAGVSAAMMLADENPAARIAVYEKGSFYTCGVCGLPRYLGEDLKTLKKAISEKEAEMASQSVDVHLRCEAIAVNPAARAVTIRGLTGNRTFTESYDKLVLATGHRVAIPDVPGAGRVGIQTLKNVEDLLFLKEYTRTPYVKDIVILGAGYEGLEIAKAFHRLGRNVRIIDSERRILSDFDPEVSELIRKELEQMGLAFQLGETVREFPGQTFIEEVRTDRGSYPCDLCICASGMTPEVELAASAGVTLDKNGAILVNERLETNVAGIYAVGSCTALRAGALRTYSLRTAGLEIARTGMTQEEAARSGHHVKSAIASGSDRPGLCPNPNRVTIKLIYDAESHRILGAQAWGAKNAAARINTLAVAVASGMTAEQLEQVNLVYSSSESSIWDPVQIVCRRAK